VAVTTYCFVRFGDDPAQAIAEAVRVGGDTDSHAAIVGAWMGARHGASALPAPLVAGIHDGPFGPTHLRALAGDLERARDVDGSTSVTRYSWPLALARNLALFPLVLAHAFRVAASAFRFRATMR
jgi:ADP-ribosyl-[dinitrogen reductase] hydrolase